MKDLAPRRVLLGVGAAIAVMVAALLADTALTYRHLTGAETSALTARDAVERGELATATAAARDASERAAAAARRTERWHWRAAARLPGIGPSVVTVRAIATAGAAAGDVADEGLRLAAPVLDGGAHALVHDGQLRLDVLRQLGDDVEILDVTGLAAAWAELDASASAGWAPAPVTAARERALELAERLTDGVETLRTAAPLASTMLGADGPRRYLVAVQNPGELRGTGGLIGFLAVLEVDDGRISLADPSGVDGSSVVDGTVLLTSSRFSRTEELAVTGPPDYEARYAGIGGASFLPSTNVDPDLPTVAPLVLEQYELASGERLDGVLAIDPLGLQLLYAALGPLDVPAGVAGFSERLPDPIPPDRIAQVLLVDSYEVLGGSSEERRRYQAEVAGSALGDVLGGDWDPLSAARGVVLAVQTRHLQLYSDEPAEQAALLAVGAAGRFAPRAEHDDLLAVTAVNIAANKADVHVGHRLTHTLQLDAVERDGATQLRRTATTRVEVLNSVDPDGDPYITSSLEPRAITEPRRFTDEVGLVRTWVTVWGPEGAALQASEDLQGRPVRSSVGTIHGLRAVDHRLDTPQGATTGVEVTLRATTPVRLGEGTATYSATVWRQAKGIADHLDVRVHPPDGWSIGEVRVEGGGVPLGLGPLPYERGIEAALLPDGTARIDGSLTADARFEVDLRRTDPT
jgi:hypothetical protein